MKCETCGTEKNIVGVASVPGVPYSAAYCRDCLEANAHPWWVLVSNTASCGGLEKMHEAWVDMVDCTCARLDKTREQFNEEVAVAIRDLNEWTPDDEKPDGDE
jgi:hypothetical protein